PEALANSRKGARHRGALADVHGQIGRLAPPAPQLGGDPLRTLGPQVDDGQPRARRCQTARQRLAEPAAAARHHRDGAVQLHPVPPLVMPCPGGAALEQLVSNPRGPGVEERVPRPSRRDDAGQALTEYAILMALVAGLNRLGDLAQKITQEHLTALLVGTAVVVVGLAFGMSRR